jgi:hypothetical protein
LATGNPAAADLPHTYITCPTPGQPARFAPLAERAQRNRWACLELAGGHFAPITMPAELAALLATQTAAQAPERARTAHGDDRAEHGQC